MAPDTLVKYDMQKAGQILDDIIQERKRELDGVVNGVIHISNIQTIQMQAKQFANPHCIRLCEGAAEDNIALVGFQGILSDKLLPPLLNRPVFNDETKGLRNIRQHVQVTGGESAYFTTYQESFKKIYDIFSAALPNGKLEPFQLGMYEGDLAIDSHNRYFTERRLAPQEEHTDFPSTIDPRGILNDIRTHKFIHGADNQVDYVIGIKEAQHREFKRSSPNIFKLGDIVEIVASFVCVPILGHRYKMIIKLRGLTLLNMDMRLVKSPQLKEEPNVSTVGNIINFTPSYHSRMKAFQPSYMISSSAVSNEKKKLKRHEIYDFDHDVESARKKFQDVQMNNT